MEIYKESQRELPMVTVYDGPKAIPVEQVCAFGDDEDEAIKKAICWAWEHKRVTRLSQRRAADWIGISNSHLSNILSKEKHLPAHKIVAYEWVVGNTAVSQTIARFAEMRKAMVAQQIGQMVAAHIMQQQAA